MPRMSNDEPRIFRPPTWQLATVVAIIVGTGSAAWALRTDPQMRWIALGLAGFALLGLGAILELFVTRVILDAEAIHIVRLAKRERYERSAIEKVVAEKGCPTALVLEDGGVARLPDFAPHPNTLRAWLSRGS